MTGRRWHLFLAAACLVLAGACHEEGDIRVASLTITGNQAVTDADIRAVLATRAGGRLPWSPAAPFNRERFQADLTRIRQLYNARGYPDARVTGIDADLNESGDAVRLRVEIDEGEPVVVEAIRFVGFDVLPEDTLRRIRASTLEAGDPRDQARLIEAERLARDTLLNSGFAHASVSVRQSEGSSPRLVIVSIEATPGPPTVFGEITVAGNTGLDESVIRRHLTFAPNDAFSHNDVVRSERRLGAIDIVQFVSINARPPAGPPIARIPVTVTVSEEPPRRLELRGGYGTEDRLRGSIEWSHLNFLGNVRRLTATGRWSSIDRGGRLAFTQPYVFTPGLSIDISASSWWTSERIYTSNQQGGRFGLAYRINPDSGRPGLDRPVDIVRGAYVVDRLRYSVRPEILADLTNVDSLIGLGLDPITGAGRGTKAALAFDYRRSATDNLANPTRGYAIETAWEEARPWLGGTFDYRKLSVEGRGYAPVGTTVVALRLRARTIAAERDTAIPFSERIFLGGSTSLRGWGRYQVSPLNGGIPVGGRSALDGSLELRMPVRGSLGAVVFVDTGNVWSEELAAVDASGLRSNIGIGLRYATPVGLVRGDIGYQLNPVEGLVVDGEPESRRWRLHFSLGQAF